MSPEPLRRIDVESPHTDSLDTDAPDTDSSDRRIDVESLQSTLSNSWPVVLERRLAYTPPFDAAGLSAFLAARAVPGVEDVDQVALRYRRTVRLSISAVGILTLDLRSHHGSPDVLLRVEGSAPLRTSEVDALVATSRDLLDLDADPAAVAAVVGADPALAPLVARRPGLRVPGPWDPFELVARAVLGQQVSVAAARTLLGRLTRLTGPALEAPAAASPELVRLFPSPAEVAAADLDRFGVPASRRRTLRVVAEAMADGSLQLQSGVDPAEATAQLRALPGIGPWTAAYVALRALGDGDSFLVGDVALARAAARQGLPDRWPALVAHAERWRPWRGYASFWLWSVLSG